MKFKELSCRWAWLKRKFTQEPSKVIRPILEVIFGGNWNCPFPCVPYFLPIPMSLSLCMSMSPTCIPKTPSYVDIPLPMLLMSNLCFQHTKSSSPMPYTNSSWSHPTPIGSLYIFPAPLPMPFPMPIILHHYAPLSLLTYVPRPSLCPVYPVEFICDEQSHQ